MGHVCALLEGMYLGVLNPYIKGLRAGGRLVGLLALNGASAALAVSSIPLLRTIAAVRVGVIDTDQPDIRGA